MLLAQGWRDKIGDRWSLGICLRELLRLNENENLEKALKLFVCSENNSFKLLLIRKSFSNP